MENRRADSGPDCCARSRVAGDSDCRFQLRGGGEIHELLTRCLRDAWLEAPRRIGPEGTLNGFGKLSGDRRIDWILFRAPWQVRQMETVARSRAGVYPSDHYPVVVEFEM